MAQINTYALPKQVLATDAPKADSANSDYTGLSAIIDLNDLNDLNRSPELINLYKARLNRKSPNYSLESSSAIEPSDGLGFSTEKKALFDYNPETFGSSSTTTTTTKAVSKSKPKAKSTRRRDPMAEWAEEDTANNGLKDKYKAQYESEVAANAKIYPTGSSTKKTNGLNYTPDNDSAQTGTQRGRR